MLSSIWNWLKNAGAAFWNAVKRLWRAVVNFFENVVLYFKNLVLNITKHIPFLGKRGKLDALEKLKNEIHNAPVKKVGGIFEGVLNEETGEIEHFQIIESDRLDEQTRNILGDDDLVVLN